MKRKKIFISLLLILTLCLGITNVEAKTCNKYTKKKNCNNNSSCKWVDKKCRVKSCATLSLSDCGTNTDKNKKKCQWNGSTCCPNGKCNQGAVMSGEISTTNKTNATTNNSSIKGCDVFGPKTTGLIKWAIKLIQVGAPLLVVALGITDFLKILLSGEEKEYKESGKKFIKRLLALVVLELLPYILFFVIDISGITSQYDIERGEIFCVLEF